MVDLDGGRERREVLEAASIDRESLDRPGIDQRRGTRHIHLNQGRAYLDRLRGGSHLHRDRQGYNGTHVHDDALESALREAGCVDRHVVDSRIERHGAEHALRPCLEVALGAGPRILDMDARFRNHGFLGVIHSSGDLSLVRVRLAQQDRRAKDTDGEQNPRVHKNNPQ